MTGTCITMVSRLAGSAEVRSVAVQPAKLIINTEPNNAIVRSYRIEFPLVRKEKCTIVLNTIPAQKAADSRNFVTFVMSLTFVTKAPKAVPGAAVDLPR